MSGLTLAGRFSYVSFQVNAGEIVNLAPEHWEQELTDMLNGYDAMRKLASSPAHIIPGHDPLVLARYPAALPDVPDIVRLDLDPIS